MSQYDSLPITQLQPGTTLADDDVFPAVDVSDLTESPSGTTKKYTMLDVQEYILGIDLWVNVTSSTQAMTPEVGYVTDNSVTPVTFTLPTTAAFGTTIKVVGMSPGGWTIEQNFGQQIMFNSSLTTLGSSGGLSSLIYTDSVELLCVREDVLFTVLNCQSPITVF